MSKVRKLFVLMAVVACAVLVLGGTAFAAKIMKMGSSTQPDHIYNKGLERFEKLVEEGTKGSIDVQLFPANQLGAERELVEGMQLGTVQGTMTSTGPMGNFLPDIKLFNLPFLFKDRKAAYKVLDGPVGTKIADKLLKVGIRSLGWAENGFRNITNSRNAVNKPEDVKGLKIRVMEDDLFIISMKALGASPLPMAFSELYTALEQKTVDAQENPLAVIHSSRFFEVQKYLAMTGHFYSPAMLLVSEAFYGSLSDAEKKVVMEAGKKACAYERELSLKADQELEAACKKEGMVITHPDKAPFQKQVAGVYSNPKVLKAIGGGDAKKGETLIKAALEAAK
jgi:tripartite ATP-independent transporter DctP family solute receptor